MLPELFSQRAPVQSQHCRGVTLVVLRVIHHRLEQWLLDLMQHHVVELATALAIQSAQEMRNGVGCTLPKWWWPCFLL